MRVESNSQNNETTGETKKGRVMSSGLRIRSRPSDLIPDHTTSGPEQPNSAAGRQATLRAFQSVSDTSEPQAASPARAITIILDGEDAGSGNGITGQDQTSTKRDAAQEEAGPSASGGARDGGGRGQEPPGAEEPAEDPDRPRNIKVAAVYDRYEEDREKTKKLRAIEKYLTTPESERGERPEVFEDEELIEAKIAGRPLLAYFRQGLEEEKEGKFIQPRARRKTPPVSPPASKEVRQTEPDEAIAEEEELPDVVDWDKEDILALFEGIKKEREIAENIDAPARGQAGEEEREDITVYVAQEEETATDQADKRGSRRHRYAHKSRLVPGEDETQEVIVGEGRELTVKEDTARSERERVIHEQNWLRTLTQDGMSIDAVAELLILDTGLTVEEFAGRIEINQGTLKSIVAGSARPSIELVNSMLKVAEFERGSKEWQLVQFIRSKTDRKEPNRMDPRSLDEFVNGIFEDQIRYLRIGSGMRQEDVGNLLDYSPTSISLLETSDADMTMHDETIRDYVGIFETLEGTPEKYKLTENQRNLLYSIMKQRRDGIPVTLTEEERAELLRSPILFKEHMNSEENRYQLSRDEEDLLLQAQTIGTTQGIISSMFLQDMGWEEMRKLSAKAEVSVDGLNNIKTGKTSFVRSQNIRKIIKAVKGYGLHHPFTQYLLEVSRQERLVKRSSAKT